MPKHHIKQIGLNFVIVTWLVVVANQLIKQLTNKQKLWQQSTQMQTLKKKFLIQKN